jgi:hypothetical protein
MHLNCWHNAVCFRFKIVALNPIRYLCSALTNVCASGPHSSSVHAAFMHVNRAVCAGADDVALSAREHGDISGRTSIDIRPSVAVLSADAEDSGELHML